MSASDIRNIFEQYVIFLLKLALSRAAGNLIEKKG